MPIWKARSNQKINIKVASKVNKMQMTKSSKAVKIKTKLKIYNFPITIKMIILPIQN